MSIVRRTAARWAGSLSGASTCHACSRAVRSRPFTRLSAATQVAELGEGYFCANDSSRPKRRFAVVLAAPDPLSSSPAVLREVEGVRTKEEEESRTTTSSPGSKTARSRRRDRLKQQNVDSSGSLEPLPLDASAALSFLASSAPPMSLKRKLLAYLSLTKPRLATLIVLTTTASYSLYPVPSVLSVAATQTPSLSTLTLLFLTTGTFSVVSAANTLNMLFEIKHDATMSRTRNRPLVRGLVSPRGAIIFAVVTAVMGTGILWFGVNPTTACLGASNVVLYAFVYTPLKRLSIINTWAGAVVGAIPPMMGWTAAGGHYLTSASDNSAAGVQSLVDEGKALLFSREAAGGWLLAALLFAWQFPHFNALSHPIRHEYATAGYKMAVSLRPRMNARVALRYSVVMFPICAGMTYYGVTDRGFLFTSSLVNGWMMKDAWRFWRTGGGESAAAQKSARALFWASVWHLPIILVLAMIHKRGLWDGVWRGLMGNDEEEQWIEDD